MYIFIGNAFELRQGTRADPRGKQPGDVSECLGIPELQIHVPAGRYRCVLQCVAVSCSVRQRVAVCCSELQRVAACFSVLQCVDSYLGLPEIQIHVPTGRYRFVLQRVAMQCAVVCCSVLRCSVLWCVAACCMFTYTTYAYMYMCFGFYVYFPA